MNTLRHKLDDFPKCNLGHLPTPLEPLARLTETLNGPRIFVKRDDCTGLAFGGNKTRKLAYVLGEAQSQGADTLITTGGLQSNHARQTAAAAAKLGMNCELVLEHVLDNPSDDYLQSGNMLLDHIVGANVQTVDTGGNLLGDQEGRSENSASDEKNINYYVDAVWDDVMKRGGKPYIVSLGASTPLGALGYVECAEEIIVQCKLLGFLPDYVVVASGSGGTQGGLIAGFKLLGCETHVLGIGVSGTSQDARKNLVKEIARDAVHLLGGIAQIDDSDIHVNGDYVGEGYGLFDDEVVNAVKLVARLEGLLIDPVYTGKAMTGLIDLIKSKAIAREKNVVFLHTGGATGLFAYKDKLLNSSHLSDAS